MIVSEKIINSLQPIINSSKHVFLNKENIKKIAKEFVNIKIPNWNNDLQFIGTPEETAQYYFFLDSINFCFWAPKDQEKWHYKIDNKWISGYYAYSRAIKDAFLKDKRFFDAEYLSNISEQDFKNIFKGKNELLLLNERLLIIRENFSILKKKFNGKAIKILEQAENDTDKFVQILIENFPSFKDIVEYEGQQFYFLKRAQIFPSDLFFTNIKELRLSKIDHLTVFSDYKLPQLLESFGILKYSDELNSDIINEKLIPKNSSRELELRANSVIACELIKDELIHLRRNITANELDWILWVKAKEKKFTKPHHKTLTTFY
jgi:hypothetical protein